MANGIQHLRRELRENNMPDTLELQNWLDPFYRGRIGIRLLLGHHIGMATCTSEAGITPACLTPAMRRFPFAPTPALSSGSQEGHIGMVAPM